MNWLEQYLEEELSKRIEAFLDDVDAELRIKLERTPEIRWIVGTAILAHVKKSLGLQL